MKISPPIIFDSFSLFLTITFPMFKPTYVKQELVKEKMKLHNMYLLLMKLIPIPAEKLSILTKKENITIPTKLVK